MRHFFLCNCNPLISFSTGHLITVLCYYDIWYIAFSTTLCLEGLLSWGLNYTDKLHWCSQCIMHSIIKHFHSMLSFLRKKNEKWNVIFFVIASNWNIHQDIVVMLWFFTAKLLWCTNQHLWVCNYYLVVSSTDINAHILSKNNYLVHWMSR